MSQLATTPPETDLQITREKGAFELLQRQAKMFADSSLVPKDFQGSIANCAIGINIAKRLGADPFMVLQNIDIIHGRPSFRATFLIAMVNAAGRFSPLQFKMQGEGQTRSCIAWTKSKDDGAILEGPEMTMAMAKAEGWSTKTGSKWLTMPELMLRYRAAAFFARLYAPDITLGMQTSEELSDSNLRDITPAPKALDFGVAATAPEMEVLPPEQAAPKEAEKPKADDFNLDASEPTTREKFSMALNEYDLTAGVAVEKFNKNLRPRKPFATLADVPEAKLEEALNDMTTFLDI